MKEFAILAGSILLLVGLVLGIPFYLMLTSKSEAGGGGGTVGGKSYVKGVASKAAAEDVGGEAVWKDLGYVSDGVNGSAWVLKRIDPDSGAIIYVMMGSSGRGAIFVVPKDRKSD